MKRESRGKVWFTNIVRSSQSGRMTILIVKLITLTKVIALCNLCANVEVGKGYNTRVSGDTKGSVIS